MPLSKSDLLESKIGDASRRLVYYVQQNLLFLIIIGFVVLTAYGFEFFNFNLTIDEELTALRTGINPGFITSGRWGLYLLTKLLLPRQTIPFIPIALTITFQFIGALIFLDFLQIQKQTDRILIAGIGLIWPGLAFLYSFSFVNFAIGFGFFCTSLSLAIFTRGKNPLKYLAAIPIAFVFSIYQPLLQPLVMVFIFYPIYHWQKERKDLAKFISSTALVIGLGFLLYNGIQQLFFLAYHTEASNYVSHYFNLRSLLQNLSIYLQKLGHLLYNVLVGDVTFYGNKVRALPLFLFVSGCLILYHAFKRREKWGYGLFFLGILTLFSVLPFIGGVLTKGYIPYRSLLGVPIFLMGWAALALQYAGPKERIIVSLLAVFTLFQFTSCMNHLFASSAFAYEEDKFLAGQLVQRIEEEKVDAGITDVVYLEIVGFVDRPSTPLVSRIENIGASFFGWDQGNPVRAAAFLEILGYEHLEGLPLERRVNYVVLGESMSTWPEPSSIRVVDDVVLIKFGSYSRTQKANLCKLENANSLPFGFCP